MTAPVASPLAHDRPRRHRRPLLSMHDKAVIEALYPGWRLFATSTRIYASGPNLYPPALRLGTRMTVDAPDALGIVVEIATWRWRAAGAA